MPRGRAKLSDKEERILVQAQLMGLNTDSMIRIGNRLRALDREKEFRRKVSEVSSGFSWTIRSNREFAIADSEGKIYDVVITRDYSHRDWNHSATDYAKITISKPGTRFKPRTIDSHKVGNPFNDEIVSACPEKNKFLYRVLRDIKSGRFDQ